MKDCKHQWETATTTARKEVLTFWVCLRCGKVSPGPTDNEALDPTQPPANLQEALEEWPRISRPFPLEDEP